MSLSIVFYHIPLEYLPKMMITSIDQIVSDMQKPGKRSLVVSDNDEFLVEPFGFQVLRVGTAQGLENVLVELDKAETQKKQSYKVDQRGIECVVIEKQIRTRRMQKMYQLQKLRQQRRVMKISLIEHSDNIANVNGCHDSDLDIVVLNLSHHDFIDQVRRIKQRYCASRPGDLTTKLDNCLADCVGESGWLIVNLSEGICFLEKFETASSVEADEKTEMEICKALDTACTQTFDECCMELSSILVDLENCDIATYDNDIDGYICSSCGIVLPFDCYNENRYDDETFQEEEEDRFVQEDEFVEEEDEEEIVEEEEFVKEEEVVEEECESSSEEESESSSEEEESESSSEEEESESSSEEESESLSESVSNGEEPSSESSSDSDDEESETLSTDDEDSTENSDSETIEDEQSAESVDDEVVVVSNVYVNQKSEDELQYEIAMQKVDSLIDQLQKTRAAAKLAKETNKAGWFEWFWASQAKK